MTSSCPSSGVGRSSNETSTRQVFSKQCFGYLAHWSLTYSAVATADMQKRGREPPRDFENVRSTVDLAAPWFICAALGLQVVGTFSVGQRSFMVGGVYVKLGSELDCMRMADLSSQTRVIAITRPGKPVLLHPRRDTRLRATDTTYLVGPYRELLDTLGKGQSASRTSAEGSGRRTA